MKFTMGSIVGEITKASMIGTSYVAKGINFAAEKVIDDKKLKKKIKEKTYLVSQKLEDSAKPISQKVEKNISKIILKSEEIGANVTRNIADKMNVSKETADNIEKCGAFAGKAIASGVTAGACVMAAGTSAVTFGGSVFTHGMATLGLGSMYVGLVTVSAIAGSVYNTEKDSSKKKKTKK